MSKYFLTAKVSNIKRTSNLENYSLAKEKKIHQKLVFKSTEEIKTVQLGRKEGERDPKRSAQLLAFGVSEPCSFTHRPQRRFCSETNSYSR